MKTNSRSFLLATGLLLLGVMLLGWAAGEGQAQTFRTVQSAQKLYGSPSFTAESLGSVPDGAEVQVIQQSGDWYQVTYEGQSGWLHQQAFPGTKKFDLSSVLKGKAVREAKTDEVALAGKGFTPEVEADFRRKHPNLNYALVDQVEAFGVNPAQLQAFIQEGGLR